MISICATFWKPNRHSFSFSRCYDESWVEKLWWGFRRNLSIPFEFVLWTDREYRFEAPVIQRPLKQAEPDYSSCIAPYELNTPSIIVGLDTIVTGTCDHLAAYCLTADRIAVPRDPYRPTQMCNGVALVPAGQRRIYDAHNGQNDMAWINAQNPACLDDLFPGEIVSFKGEAWHKGIDGVRIVYFHGEAKPHQLSGFVPWIDQHWSTGPIDKAA